MPLETATFIHQLNAANPLGSDPVAAGDDHLRMIKSAIKSTFPNITGPITVSQSDINDKVPNAVQKDGSVAMTGELILVGNPTTNLGAAPKQYVDTASGNLTAAIALKADKAITITGTGSITGGGDLSANRTLDLATTGVTAGNYGSASQIPVLTVNNKGQITAASTAAVQGLGLGGTVWNDVTSSRGFGVTYTNSRNYPIMISASTNYTDGSQDLVGYVNGGLVAFWKWQFNGAGAVGGTTFIVPPGATYMCSPTGGTRGLMRWVELY